MSKSCYIVLAVLACCVYTQSDDGDKYRKLEKEIRALRETLSIVTRQLMLQQFFTEEKIRNDGFSGIKQIRTSHGGRKNYFSNTYSGEAFAAMHDHANNIRTVGLGEFVGVLNGVEFRTRHNDYRLNQPHSTSSKYHAIEPIKFPEVPPEVLTQPNISSQIDEMRKWFQAWKESNHTVRDYRKYFQPVLCYLEGAWTRAEQDGSIDEPFESDRHFVDANSWFDLQEQVKFTSYTGTKSLSENLAFLPTTIMGVKKKTGRPRFAQWNYRILCHKLKTHVPLTKLRPVEDLASRMSRHINETEYSQSRAARFELDLDLNSDSSKFHERLSKYDFLDKLMEEVPGKDNYQGRLNDGGFDSEIYDMNGKKPKDVSKYHRWFTLRKTDAMGKTDGHRGYADQYLFAAKTTQNKIAGMRLRVCEKDSETKRRKCRKRNEKWSYAIPLEIIYLTPLTNWNPHSIRVETNCRVKGQTDRNDARVGKGLCKDMSKAKTYACPQFYYVTPDEFFSGNEVHTDPADTAHTNGWCMLDKNKNGVIARATGTRIFFPAIPGIGKLRQRFPIAPVHGEGNPIWKNLNALSDIVLHNGTYDFMKTSEKRKLDRAVTFQLTMSKIESKKPPHAHYFTLFESDVMELVNGGTIKASTGMRQNHYHTLVIRYNKDKKYFYYTHCDDLPLCYDKHPRIIAKVSG